MSGRRPGAGGSEDIDLDIPVDYDEVVEKESPHVVHRGIVAPKVEKEEEFSPPSEAPAEQEGEEEPPAPVEAAVEVEYATAAAAAAAVVHAVDEETVEDQRHPFSFSKRPVAESHPLLHIPKVPLEAGSLSPAQVRYTFSGLQISVDADKIAAERARHPWTTDRPRTVLKGSKHTEDEQEKQGDTAQGMSKPQEVGERTSVGPEKPSYAEVASKTPPPRGDESEEGHSPTDLGGSYEKVSLPSTDLPPLPNETAAEHEALIKTEPEKEQVEDKAFRGPQGQELSRAIAQDESAVDAETHELQPNALTSGDIGTNVGDRQHQERAHEEKKHSINLPPQPHVEFTSGPAVPTAKVRSNSIDYPAKRHPTEPAEGHHAKMPRRTSTDLGMEPITETPAVSKDDVLLAHRQEDCDTMKKYRSIREEKPGVEGEPTSQLLEGALSSEDAVSYEAPIPEASIAELRQLIQIRDTSIEDLQQTIVTLTSRIEVLELQNTTTAGERVQILNAEEEVQEFTKITKPAETDTDTLIKWGLWGGALIGAATLGGWLGALVERGTVGRQVAEWLWRQAGRA